jgi:glycosyltransferase involved in cell wall biosynthesis
MDGIPLVSVILPTYNRAKILPLAINSIFDQTYPQWELLIWNDGSQDETEAIISSYTDQRIRHFCDKNHGVSYALNKAIEYSRGDYIAFLDDDDYWEGEKLSIQMNLLINNPKIDLVFGNYLNVNKTTGEKRIGFEQSKEAFRELKKKKIDDSNFIIMGNLSKSICIDNFIAFDSVIVRKDILDMVGMFNENLRNGMDFEYWWRLVLLGRVFAFTNEIVLNRIKNQGGLSDKSIITCRNHLKSLDFCLQATLSRGRPDLIPYLNRSYRNTWQNLINMYGGVGNRKAMLDAFFQAMQYGFNLGTIRLLAQSVRTLIRHGETNE